MFSPLYREKIGKEGKEKAEIFPPPLLKEFRNFRTFNKNYSSKVKKNPWKIYTPVGYFLKDTYVSEKYLESG